MKLSKIRLVNWHIFNNNTIDINGNVVITGENGHGKSTLIDGLFYVLSGGEEHHFNNAANSASQRTLESYVRCKLGVEGKTYKRPEPEVTAHIALEFTHERPNHTKVKHVLGVVIEVVEHKKPDSRFYYAKGIGIDDINYTDDANKVATFADIRKACGSEFVDLGKVLKTVRRQIAEILQINSGEAYYNLLIKAISFSPLDNEITSFVNTFLLKEDNIDITSLKQDIETYRSFKQLVDKENAKLKCLEGFVFDGIKYKENIKVLDYLETINYKQRINTFISNKEKAEKDLKIEEQNNTRLKKKRDELNEDCTELKFRFKTLENNDTRAAYKDAKKQKDEFLLKLNIAKEKLQRNEAMINNEQNVAKELELDFNFQKYIENRDIASLNIELHQYHNALQILKEKNSKSQWNLETKIKNIDEDIQDVKEELNNLQLGKNQYSQEIVRFISTIKHELKVIYGEEPNVIPLCECFEITDEKWADAIEGYLSNQRFNIIVEPKYYKDALRIYYRNSKIHSLYEINLVNTTHVEDFPVMENSLYSKIEVKNAYATSILKLLLGKVAAVDSIDDLSSYHTAITKDCMLYKNLCAKALKPARYEKHFIGKYSQQQRIDYCENTLKGFYSRKEELNKDLVIYKETLKVIANSEYHNNDLKDVWFEVDSLTNKIEDLQKTIDQMSEDPDFIELQEQMDYVDKQIYETNKLLSDVANSISESDMKKGKLETKIETFNEGIAENEELYNQKIHVKKYDKDYFDYESKCLADENLNIEDEQYNIKLKNREYEPSIKKGIREYFENFEKSFGTDLEDVGNYIAKYNNIKDHEIFNFQTQADEAYQVASRSFNAKFVSTLRKKIKLAQETLKSINRVLDKHPFGYEEERYSFTYSASSTNDLGRYYRVINSGRGMGNEGLLVEEMTDEEKATIKELFDRITDETDDTKASQDLHILLDYRRYMQYELNIKNKNNEVSYFSKIAREKSGGETQNPYYIVIAACFEELIKREAADSSCIVVFDEAFNNMDETRIVTLLNYYKQLDIQFIIGVPTNRSHMLIPSMDSRIGLLKRNNSVKINYMNKTNNENE